MASEEQASVQRSLLMARIAVDQAMRLVGMSPDAGRIEAPPSPASVATFVIVTPMAWRIDEGAVPVTIEARGSGGRAVGDFVGFVTLQTEGGLIARISDIENGVVPLAGPFIGGRWSGKVLLVQNPAVVPALVTMRFVCHDVMGRSAGMSPPFKLIGRGR